MLFTYDLEPCLCDEFGEVVGIRWQPKPKENIGKSESSGRVPRMRKARCLGMKKPGPKKKGKKGPRLSVVC